MYALEHTLRTFEVLRETLNMNEAEPEYRTLIEVNSLFSGSITAEKRRATNSNDVSYDIANENHK